MESSRTQQHFQQGKQIVRTARADGSEVFRARAKPCPAVAAGEGRGGAGGGLHASLIRTHAEPFFDYNFARLRERYSAMIGAFRPQFIYFEGVDWLR